MDVLILMIFLMCYRLTIGSIDAALNLIDVGIDGCNGYDVDYIAHTGSEVDKVDGLVESHLDRTDDFYVGIEHLQHLLAGACRGEVGEYQCVDILGKHAGEWILVVAQIAVEGKA